MHPGSSRCSALAALCALCAGCSTSPHFASSATLPKGDIRRAPGVSQVRPEQLPDPVQRGESRDQLLLLRAPPTTELARDAVRDFLRAAVNETPERMEPLLSSEAFVDTGAGRQPLRSFWLARMAQLDYTELKGQLLFRDADMQTFRAQDVARLPAKRRISLELAQNEVAVRVPIAISWTGRTRLFGDELLFRLQPAGARFEITEIAEDFRLP